MASVRPFATLHTVDQWLRCAHVATAIDADNRWVELGPGPEPGAGATPPTAPAGPPGGLAFDSHCRWYRSDVETGSVASALFRPDRLQVGGSLESELDLFPAEPAALGDFATDDAAPGSLLAPRGLAVAPRDRLYVAESGKHRVLVYDLFERRLRAIIPTAPEGSSGPRPIDLATHGEQVFVLTEPPKLLVIVHEQVVAELAIPEAVAPTRVAASPNGRLALLDGGQSKVLLVGEPGAIDVSEHATDLEFDGEHGVVVAAWPGEDFRRHRFQDPQPTRPWLRARGYDGRGIVRVPDGRLGFFTARGLRIALQDRASYVASGSVTGFRLDSGQWQTVWGRCFIDACVPEGTRVRFFCASADEPPEETALERTPPVNATDAAVPYADRSPPMPPLSLVATDETEYAELHRRSNGRELPWAPPGDDGFATFEAPVPAGPGRYLWISLLLDGSTRQSPRIRSVRVEYPSHDALARLPKVYSAEPTMASFLRRYLTPLEGLFSEFDAKAFQRAALLDPDATPEAALPWLANFLGMVLDERWARAPRPGGRPDGAAHACDASDRFDRAPRGFHYVDARRALIKNATCLFRLRGTLEGLTRFIQIYTGVPVVILEQFRVRGLGGAVIGAEAPAFSSGVVGSLRVGGAVGSADASPLTGSVADAFRTHAHRFSVIVPAAFTEEELDVVRHIITVHRPAHTLFDLCIVGAGVRLGLGAHVGLSSFVGEDSGFTQLRAGGSVVGRDGILGRPEPEVLLQRQTMFGAGT